MTPSKVLLVGGTGFVGRALCRRLAGSAMRVDIIGRRKNVAMRGANIHVHLARLDEVNLLKRLLADGCVVFYLASDTTPGSHPGLPTVEAERNIVPALRFLEALQNYRDCRVVYLSSGGTIYGNQSALGTDESRRVAPLSYYGATKAALESFFSAYQHQFSADVTVLRPSNLYGPGQDCRPDFGAVRKMLECLRTGEPFVIWGDGENVRDYLFIEDFVDACVDVLHAKFADERAIRVFNVGVGHGYSVNAVCAAAEQATGRKLRRVYREGRAVDVRSIVLDSSHIESALGWKAHTSLADGIALTWRWLASHDD